jgi:homoserine kinase type II
MQSDDEYHELLATCERWFGFEVLDATPIIRGWLNRKWRLETTKGQFLLKSYHPDRFRRYDEQALIRALRWQSEMQEQGFPCPEILTYQGERIHCTSSGHRFMLMTFCEGQRLIPGKAITNEMYSLGRATGLMHQLLTSLGGCPTTATFSLPDTSDRISHWRRLYVAMQREGKDELLPFVERQWRATEVIDITEFIDAEVGWAHRDLWADNILVSDDKLSAILDFDRLNSDYLELDVARAIMSGTLDREELNTVSLEAFLDGYRSERPFPPGRILRSLRMLWYMESSWWITENMDKHTVPPQRFAHEMDWLACHMEVLPSLVGSC